MTRTSRQWTPAEDTLLRERWAQGASPKSIARALPGRTPVAVYQRAHRAGLTSCAPQGWERVSKAAERSGLAMATFHRVMSDAGVRYSPAQAAPWLKQNSARQRIVRRAQVNRALRDHFQRESVTSAARRSNVGVDYLLKRLHSMGIRARKRRAKLLITEEQLQAALAMGPKNKLFRRTAA